MGPGGGSGRVIPPSACYRRHLVGVRGVAAGTDGGGISVHSFGDLPAVKAMLLQLSHESSAQSSEQKEPCTKRTACDLLQGRPGMH
jgi:hypothetical protein